MSGMLEHIYEACCMPSLWADENPNICGCRGRGWMLSDLDTWHHCPIHGKGVPHPLEEETRWAAEEYEARQQSHDDVVTGNTVNHIEQPVTIIKAYEDDDIPF